MAAAHARQSWWRRPVGLRALVWTVASVALLWALVLGAGVWLFYRHWQVGVQVQAQTVQLHLPGGMAATASVEAPVRVPLKVRPVVPLHLDQSVSATLDQAVLTRVQIKQTVPIDTEVPVRLTVPVQTRLQMKVRVREHLPEVEVDVPVTLSLPVDWRIPVRAQLPLDLSLLVSGQLRHTLNVPVQADWTLRPLVDTTLRARVQGQTRFLLQDTGVSLPLTIERAEVRLPIDLRWQGQP